MVEKGKLSLSLAFLYYYGKLIGLFPLVMEPNGSLKYSQAGIIYSILNCCIHIVAFFRLIIHRAHIKFPMETFISVIANSLSVTLNFSITLLSWIIFAFRQRELLIIINEFMRTNLIARQLGIHDNQWEIVSIINRHLIIINISYIGILIFDNVIYSTFTDFDWMLWIPYNLPQIIVHNLIILFVTLLQVLQRKFHRLNKKLRYLSLRDDYRNGSSIVECRYKKNYLFFFNIFRCVLFFNQFSNAQALRELFVGKNLQFRIFTQ